MAYGNLLTDVVQSSTTGTAPVFKDGNGTETGQLCRAWVNFNGTSGSTAIRGSFNISSITRNGSGDFTLTFTNALSNSNYAYTAMAGNGAAGESNGRLQPYSTTSMTTTSMRVYYVGSAYYDPATACIAVFG